MISPEILLLEVGKELNKKNKKNYSYEKNYYINFIGSSLPGRRVPKS
jgi:hypothetical protein